MTLQVGGKRLFICLSCFMIRWRRIKSFVVIPVPSSIDHGYEDNERIV